ncbi:PIN domain-containing protein [Sphingomonas sp. Mn802worker]|uniref:PIN domain-containing protein n=1 Tax=Sphingomonas sp. Mn802worker TaxID=629773 RepID=UPI0003791EB7|nr:PIN domain-containing protein [Sphingomonas sp. Mn802worker]
MPYDAFTIDTNAIIQGGINFDAGLLAQLDQFKDGPIQFVISEIVVRETLKHLQANTKKARDSTRAAMDRAVHLGLIAPEAAKAATDALADSRAVARNRVAAFLEATGAETVPANLCAIDALLKSYFDPTPPFEGAGDKKNEFPDALALLSLEAWAKAGGKTVLAASADKGWQSFAETSNYVFVEGDLAAALQIVQAHAETAAEKVNTFLRRISEGDLPEDEKSLHAMLADALVEWDFDVEATAPYRYEVDATELRLESLELNEKDGDYGVTVVRLAAEEVVVRVDVEITAMAHVEFSLFAWDSIDREEIGMGGTAAASEETFDAALLITIAGSIDGAVADLEVIEVEVVEGLGSVDMGEIHLDYGGREDFDDYNQLQLMLEVEGNGAESALDAEGNGSAAF